MGARAERAAAGIVTKQKTAPLPAPFLVHLRVESAHFDWRWRERPVLALLAWEAQLAIRSRGYAASKWSQLERKLILGAMKARQTIGQSPSWGGPSKRYARP